MVIIPSAGIAIPVFVSYAWESEEHKKWVLAFAERLREHGIDAIIDQTHLPLGARIPEFMERSVRESGRVLVVCTEMYKRRFDEREGGAGYEGHIITGEIVNEVGKNKFIPVLRNGNWESAIPTALSGVHGVDLRSDSPAEYEKLIGTLHDVFHVPPVGPRPAWLGGARDSLERNIVTSAVPKADPEEFWEQRKRLPETDLLKKIWSKARWRVWIRPTQFRRARFQTLDQCRDFMISSYVLVQGWFPYPWFSTDTIETGAEWVAGEIDHSDKTMSRVERWALFRSGQFVHNRSFDEIPQLGDRVHVLEILDTVTGAFEFAARMADRGVLSPDAAITLELYGVDGRALTWPQNVLGDKDAVGPNCWCQDETISADRRVTADELKARRRDLALEVAFEIYSKFGWSDPPKQRLTEEQRRRFGD
jgi:hypothetical protein